MNGEPKSARLWLRTPLIHSSYLSARLQCDVYLKLENLQPSQSFKYRGISLFAQHCKETFGDSAHLIIASGGNAGHAAAVAAKSLNLKCTIYIPEGTSQRILDILKNEGAEVVVIGKYYLQSLDTATKAAKSNPQAALVPAYDHPLIWEGHSSMITEIAEDLPSAPDAIVCSVGGGGLLGGVLEGCKKNGWERVPIVALETHGAACFSHAISINAGGWLHELSDDLASVSYEEEYNVKIAHLKELRSKASSLGATAASAGVIRKALDHTGGVICGTIPDELAMSTAILFAEDHKTMVELACSTTLAPAYSPPFLSQLLENRKGGGMGKPKTVVFIICGGVKISLEEIHQYQAAVDSYTKMTFEWRVTCNGKEMSISC